jgi:hypothetical protein
MSNSPAAQGSGSAGSSGGNRFFGKYRGQVANNLDPQLGRIQVTVPEVLGDGRLSWALPCVPFAGPGVGFFALPPIGANVWVEFEGGDPDFPVWSGCFWGPGQVPAKPATPALAMIKTLGITIALSDTGLGLIIDVKPPAAPVPMKLVMGPAGIELMNGKNSVKLTPVSVSVNNGALEVI